VVWLDLTEEMCQCAGREAYVVYERSYDFTSCEISDPMVSFKAVAVLLASQEAATGSEIWGRVTADREARQVCNRFSGVVRFDLLELDTGKFL
jgi:hypothetical protein